MTSLQALDVGLAVLLVMLAVRTIGARETFAAVVGFMTYGLLLALALLAAFATVAFVKFAASPPSGEAGPDDAL